MPKPSIAAAGMLSLLLSASCGNRETAAAESNVTVPEGTASEGNATGNSAPAEPAQPGAPANGSDEPVPPPDAVSHPNGYLPPAPAEPGSQPSNSSAPDSSPPATEDEYIRNGR
jgi:hypothetical protein